MSRVVHFEVHAGVPERAIAFYGKKAIVAAGGTVAPAKQPIPGLAWLACAKDTEGNIFGIYQADSNAK